MIVFKNLKLFCIFVLSFGMSTEGRSVSHSQMGDVVIDITDEKWQCDKIECPLETASCFVSKSNEEDPSVLKRVNICYSKDKEILKQEHFNSTANPNTKIRFQTNSTRNGIVSVADGHFDGKKLNKEVKKEIANSVNKMKDIHDKAMKMHKDITAHIHNQIRNMQNNLGGMDYPGNYMYDDIHFGPAYYPDYYY